MSIREEVAERTKTLPHNGKAGGRHYQESLDNIDQLLELGEAMAEELCRIHRTQITGNVDAWVRIVGTPQDAQ